MAVLFTGPRYVSVTHCSTNRQEQTLYVEHAITTPGAQHWVSIATEEQASSWNMLLAAAVLAPVLAIGASWWLYSR